MTFVYLSLSPDSMLSGGLERKGQELHKLALLRIDVCARKARSCGHPVNVCHPPDVTGGHRAASDASTNVSSGRWE
jgi:hypothetical protein